MNEKSRTVLISGIGVAGPALAHWLLRLGFAPTLIERAPRVRTGGYVIDFWGAGLDIVERMGLLPEVMAAGYRLREVRFVGKRGERSGGFDADVFARSTGGRFTSILRSELSAILFCSIEGKVPVIFDDTITALADTADGVDVTFAKHAPRRFDLVVGADGLHSTVRSLAFGPEASFERFLSYTVAAFSIDDYPHRDSDRYILFSAPGTQIGRFTMRDGRTMFLMVVADDAPPTCVDDAERKAYLRAKFDSDDWECREIVAALQDVGDLYFDRVSQIRMDHWTKGRCALIGDAAHCPSLLAGQGAALAIIDAYVLAVELARHSSHEEAFAAYERLLMPFVTKKQDAAARFAGSFAPRSRAAILLRDLVTRLFVVPGVAKLAIGSSIVDELALPEVPAPIS